MSNFSAFHQHNNRDRLSQNNMAEKSGPPPEVIPNIPVGRNRNRPFHLTCDRSRWHNGKHPLWLDQVTCYYKEGVLCNQSIGLQPPLPAMFRDCFEKNLEIASLPTFILGLSKSDWRQFTSLSSTHPVRASFKTSAAP